MSFLKKEYEDNHKKWLKRSKEINISNIEEIGDLEIVGFCYLCGETFDICMNNEENTITFSSSSSCHSPISTTSTSCYGISYKLCSVEITGKCPKCGYHNKFEYDLILNLESK